MEHVKAFQNKMWLLLFRHDMHEKEIYFSNENEFLFSNTKEKFSILGTLDDSFLINQKFEFLLEYPDVEGFNIWTQTINPLNAIPEQSNGYVPVKESFTENSWNGLSRSSSVNSFLDGSPTNETWFYAIGLKGSWLEKSIPGPYDLGQDKYSNNLAKYATYEVKLWIRINFKFNTKCPRFIPFANIAFVFVCVFCLSP